MANLSVRTPGLPGEYEIRVEQGLLARPGPEVEKLAPSAIAIVTDSNVAPLHLGRVRASFPTPPAVEIVVPAGESSKSLERASAILDRLVGAGLDRRAVVVALGGGVVGDLAGFVAAILLRGVRLVMLPTTLLAQVDSSVGGKVGVNHPLGKNLIGAFHQPSLVLADPEALSTLPPREIASGLAEVVKCALLRPDPLLARLESGLGELLAPATVAGGVDVILECCRIKAGIIAADERESGLRRILNLGHTFAHAIEAATDYALFRHGEAVALGLRAALFLSRDSAGLPDDEFERALSLVRQIPVPDFRIPRDRERLAAAVVRDKKVESGAVQAVVLERLGRPKTLAVPPATIVDGILSLPKA